jgi:HlyD family secretion protein
LKKIFIAIVVIVAVGLMIFYNLNKSEGEGFGNPFANNNAQEVEAAVIQRGDIASNILITGSVEEIHKKEIMTNTPVKVLEVYVKNGDLVSKDQALFSVDVTSLEEELSQLKVTYEIQTLQLEKLKKLSTTSSTTGLEIGLELSKLTLSGAQRLYDDQVAALESNKTLLESGIISQSEYDAMAKGVDEAQSQIDTATLNVERAQADLAGIKKNNSQSSQSSEIDVKIQLKNLESLDLNIAKIENQIVELQKVTIAPVGGIVTGLTLVPLEYAQTMVPLMILMDMNSLKVVASVREYDITDLAIDQEVAITGDAIPKDQIVSGKISYIAPLAIQGVVNGKQTTAVEIEILITEGSKYLKPGYTADCEITTLFKKDIVVASYDMFREDKENNKLVYVIDENNTLVEKTVTVGITSDFDAEIVEGLEAGDIVVTNPSLSLKPGMKVTVADGLEGEGE